MVEEQKREILRDSGLARRICGGEGKQFHNERCEHFDPLTRECRLLRDLPIVAVFDKRCLSKREFYARAHVFLTRYPEHLRGQDVDLEEFIFGRHEDKKDRKGILEYELKVPTIHYMYSFINRSLKREIEQILKDKDLVPKNRQCGNCVHRRPADPHICQLEQIPGNKAVKPYYNRYFGTERTAEDPPCGGHVALVPHLNPLNDEVAAMEVSLTGSHVALRLGALGWKDQLEQFEALLDVPVMFKAILRCATNATPGKVEERFRRWYKDTAHVYKLLEECGTYHQAKSLYLETKFGKNTAKRDAYAAKMRRDKDNLCKCLSGEERCRGHSGPGGMTMTEDERKILQKEFRKAGSVPALLEKMAQSESKEFRQLRHQVEQGPHHPTGDELYDYVLGWLDKKDMLLIMEHLLLCGKCLQEVMEIEQLEEELTEDALARADKVPWLERIKSFISKLSFPVSIHAPALVSVKGVEPKERRYALGTELIISAEAPADGYIAVFHGCEETGKVELVFPLYATDDPRVLAHQEISPISGQVEGPPGVHWFKIIWTRSLVLNPADYRLGDVHGRERALAAFFEGLEKLSEEDRQENTCEYLVY